MALDLWVNMRRHYEAMRRAQWHYNEVANDETFERLWIGAGRLFLESKYSDEMIQPVRLRAKQSEVSLIHCLFMHCGTDKIDFRFFACYSDKVSYIQIYTSTRYAW